MVDPEYLKKKSQIVKSFIHYGNPIAKNLIPREYRLKYGVTNLFRVELPKFWRMIYTLTNEGDDIVVFILDIMDRKKYNKKF